MFFGKLSLFDQGEMSETCDFGKLLKMPCDKLDFCIIVGIKKLTELTKDEQQILLWRSDLLSQSRELTICFHHEHVFGNIFERRAIIFCGVLSSHQCKVKGKTRQLQ